MTIDQLPPDDMPPMPGEADMLGLTSPWTQELRRSDKGALIASPRNLAIILANHGGWSTALSYNERSDLIEWATPSPVPELRDRVGQGLRDEDETAIQVWLEATYHCVFGERVLHAGLAHLAVQNAHDPVRTWLNGLRWDADPRLDTWTQRLLGAKDTALNREFGARWMISAVARALSPGCQADHMLVLEGPQGAGKSSALAALVPQPLWFSSSLPDIKDKKAAQEGILGPWIIEIGELDAMSNADTSRVKSFLTERNDRFRAAYARNTGVHPRRVVFAGSTNDEHYLKDATGGRRFWPIYCHAIRPATEIATEREQLWAEAVERYQNGARWHITDEALVMAASKAQAARHQADPWEGPLEELAVSETTKAAGKIPRITVQQAFAAVRVDLARQDGHATRRVAACFRRLGWVQRQRRDGFDGSRRRAYEPRHSSADTDDDDCP